MKKSSIADATLTRLSMYHCYINELLLAGKKAVLTSEDLAGDLGIHPDLIRKDLSTLGEIGTRGLGYDPTHLYRALSEFLGQTKLHSLAFVGNGDLASGMLCMFPFQKFGFELKAIFSENPHDAGRVVGGIDVYAFDSIVKIITEKEIKIAMVASSPATADSVVEQLAQGGVQGILNISPSLIHPPEGIFIHNVNLPCDLKVLVYKCKI